jgi:hypothetical protein
VKSLRDVQVDMSDLYDMVKSGSVEIKMAAELANIAGKYLKAEQLILAREIFTNGLANRTPLADRVDESQKRLAQNVAQTP